MATDPPIRRDYSVLEDLLGARFQAKEGKALPHDELAAEALRSASTTVRMRPSSFSGMPSTVFFDYPTELMYQRVDVCVEEALEGRKLRFDTHWERNCIKKAFVRAGYTRSLKKWTALWSKHQSEEALRSLNCLQKVNHFPNSWCIGRKDRLLRLVTAMKRLHGAEYAIHPDGYILPAEKDALLRQVQDIDSKASSRRVREGLWICKPVSSSCGRGIRVLTKDKLLKYLSRDKEKSVIMQRYVDDPYLINGKKFDMRVYVLVTGVDPMRVYVHSQGLTRISTAKYSLNNTKDKFAHLTNYSINKDSDKFVEATIDADTGNCDDYDEKSYKWSLIAFKKYLEQKTSREVMEATFRRVDELLVKTMIAAESEITPRVFSDCQYRSNCYELFGCDVMLDAKLTPHLIEVNVSPSLMGSSPLDRQIKGLLVADMFHLVGLYPHDNKLLAQFDTETAQRTRTPSAGRMRKGPTAGGDISSANGVISRKASPSVTTTNPFAFNALSRMLASQEGWRRKPTPREIDMSALNVPGNEGIMTLLLSIEDEFDRCVSTHFCRVHPVPESCERFVGLYRSPRFSDHLLTRWLLENGSKGPLKKLIPKHHLRKDAHSGSPSRPTTASTVSALRGNIEVASDDSDYAEGGESFGADGDNDSADDDFEDSGPGGAISDKDSIELSDKDCSDHEPTAVINPHKKQDETQVMRHEMDAMYAEPRGHDKKSHRRMTSLAEAEASRHQKQHQPNQRPLPPRFSETSRSRSESSRRDNQARPPRTPLVTKVSLNIGAGLGAAASINRPGAPKVIMRSGGNRPRFESDTATVASHKSDKSDGGLGLSSKLTRGDVSRVHPFYSRLPAK